MRIAIIGAGKIGFTILSALNKMSNVELIATGRSNSTLEKIKSIGVEATTDNNYAVSSSDYIILSVKPRHFPSVLKSVKKLGRQEGCFSNGWDKDFNSFFTPKRK